ncbi:MAG: UDP-N-acetylmuramate dehydrogenase [Smithellaceae bacterium]|nr:UDP-N-acetylmuramate dehydrogenase [Smithellaceae bacterium]
MTSSERLQQRLRDLTEGTVLFGELAGRYTSMGVGGPADIIVFPLDVLELTKIVVLFKEERIPFLPVGNWTNLIVTDKGYRGALICLKGLRGVKKETAADGAVTIRAEAGVPLSEIVNLALRESLGGMEFCAGIPGTAGGAVKMNAGAYGSEIKDVLLWATLMNTSGKISRVARHALSFSYRNLELKEGEVILEAAFGLRRGRSDKIKERIAEILALRKQKHPLEFRNAGSIFKNPKDKPAGKIIEELGLKGTRVGDAQVSEKHGNFIVNLGHAKAADVVALIETISKKVKKETGISLETEVKVVGN